MSKLNTNRRRFNTVFRRCTVQQSPHFWTDVPVIATHGEWPIVESLSDESMLSLAKFYASKGVLPQ